MKEPGAAHQSLMRGLREVTMRHGADGMPGVERIAILAQLIGQEIADLPPGSGITSAEIMHAVAGNIAAGNRVAAAPPVKLQS